MIWRETMDSMKLLVAPEETKLIEYKPVMTPVHATPKTLKQYMAEKKARKVRVMARSKIREKIDSLAKDMREAGIRYLSPKDMLGRHYNSRQWSGYYSYLLTVAREAL
jgi:hypothetical protein